MNGVTFDTYQLVSDLKEVGFNERQAEAVVNTIKKSHKDADVATKGDIKELRTEFRYEMRELEHRLTNQLTIRFGVMLAASVGMLAVLMEIL